MVQQEDGDEKADEHEEDRRHPHPRVVSGGTHTRRGDGRDRKGGDQGGAEPRDRARVR